MIKESERVLVCCTGHPDEIPENPMPESGTSFKGNLGQYDRILKDLEERREEKPPRETHGSGFTAKA